MKRLLSIICVCVLLLSWGGQGYDVSAAEEEVIQDPYLRSNLKMILNKAQGEELTAEDVEKLTVIDLPSSGIRSLAGLEHAVHLTHLRIPYNQIEDISPLRNLTTLQEVDITSNYVDSIDALAKSTNMGRLLVSNNAITSLDVVRNFTRLHTLYAGGNQITSLDSLLHAKSLRVLDINSNQINDISSLTELQNLKELDLSYNQLTDMSDLDKLSPSLTSLKIGFNRSTDPNVLRHLSHLTNLKVLDVSGMNLNELISVGELKQLTDLNISNNSISDLEPLRGLNDLTDLNASGNQIADLSPLQQIKGIRNLNLSDNAVWDLEPIQDHSFTYTRQETSGETPYYGLHLKNNNLDLNYGTKTWELFTKLGANPEDIVSQRKYHRLVIDSKTAYDGDTSYSIDAAPFTYKGRTYVPLRFLSEQSGAEVTWNQAKKEITIQKDHKTISWTSGNRQVKVNGEVIVYDVPLKLQDGCAYVPLRFVSELLGSQIRYLHQAKTILIYEAE